MAKKNVIIEVNGDHKLMKLGFNGLIELEETLGKPITEIANGEVKFADLRTMFYIALKHGGDKNITVEQTGDLLDDVMSEKGMQYLTDKLTELFNNVMGVQDQQSFLATT